MSPKNDELSVDQLFYLLSMQFKQELTIESKTEMHRLYTLSQEHFPPCFDYIYGMEVALKIEP